MRITLCIPVLLASFGGPVAAAELRTGADLVTACHDERNPGICMNYLLNMADAHDALAAWGAVLPQWCTPDRVTHHQLRDAFLTYSAAHPELAGRAVDEAVTEALRATYPCSAEASPRD
jgi:hypothetical protein